jgi:hypothetical protein
LPRARPEVRPITTVLEDTTPLEPTPAHDPAPATGPEGHEVSALVWVGLATALVGLGGAIGGHLVAEDARSQRAATLLAECSSATPACMARRDTLSAELVPFEVVVNLAWGITALGGVLSGVGLGLTLSGGPTGEGTAVRLTPSGLEGAF